MDETLIVATLLWDANGNSKSFSRMYDESWVHKLYWGAKRNLTKYRMEFHCWVDRPRDLEPWIKQHLIRSACPGYGDCIQPFEMNRPMILMGLDTIITGNIDRLADYCFRASKVALPKAVYKNNTVCNGVALIPAGNADIYTRWNGENDMEWLRRQPYAVIDDLFPGAVISYKRDVKKRGVGGAAIVFFHGEEKPHQLNEEWIKEHWR